MVWFRGACVDLQGAIWPYCQRVLLYRHDEPRLEVVEHGDAQTVHVELGKRSIFNTRRMTFFIFEVAGDQEQAARTVRKMKPLN
jgi:hypothetical protein